MDWVERINSVMEYIEENLDGTIDDGRIASLFASPADIFRRIFTNMTGIALSEYIRKRRLTNAVTDIRNTDVKLLDIAIKYGYGSAAAFGNAFKAFHGVTPSSTRSTDVQLNSLQPFAFTLILTDKGVKSMQYYNIENARFIMGQMVNKKHVKPYIRDVSRHKDTWCSCDGYRAMVILPETKEPWDMSDAYFNTGDPANPVFSLDPIFTDHDNSLKVSLSKEQAAVLLASFGGARTENQRKMMSLKSSDNSGQDVVVCMDINTMGIITEATSTQKKGIAPEPVMNFMVNFIEDALRFTMCSDCDEIEIYYGGNTSPLILRSGRFYAAVLPVMFRDDD